jgi:hypothetical protein
LGLKRDMKIAIAGTDYTSALDATEPLTIERKLNEPSQCRFKLAIHANGKLVVPARIQSVAITGDNGIDYFTGHVAASPTPEFVGLGIDGPHYRFAVVALSDEARSLTPARSIVHPLDEVDGTLNPANLSLVASVDRVPVNDVTVCGEREPVAYVTEYFQGDGVTGSFYLADQPYFLPVAKAVIIREQFDGREIDARLWANTGGSGNFELGAGGLSMRGGTGVDGQTVLSWLAPVEMGGTLLLEAVGMTLAGGSGGIVAGLFDGSIDSSSCAVGFKVAVQSGAENVTLQPLIQGVAAGIAIGVNPLSQYTLRIRVHSPECYRSLAIYRAASDGGVVTAGGQWNQSPGKLQFEVQEFVNGVGGMPVTLYDGAVTNLPGECTIVAVSSLNLVGSIRALHLTSLGSGWVVSTPPGGGAYARRMGTPVEAGECQLDRAGKLQFESGSIPVAGEQIAVSYRTVGRAAGRAVNTENQQALTQAGLPTLSAWAGSVTDPPARCSADCRNAALVTAQTAAAESGVLQGNYKGTCREFVGDLWPGDSLLLDAPSASLDSKVIIREVKVSYSPSIPDVVDYGINFANELAQDLAIKRSSTVPADAWLPVLIAPTVLPNVTGLTVTALTAGTVSINTGLTPPDGGGFEVRRRDFAFVAGNDAGLVTRSSMPNITFARESANDRFFVRMYDGATPPNYSEFSTALFINLPWGS